MYSSNESSETNLGAHFPIRFLQCYRSKRLRLRRMLMQVKKPKTWQKCYWGHGKYTRKERCGDFVRKLQDTKSEKTTFTLFLGDLKGKGAIIS